VVAINRALAVAELHGANALQAIRELGADARLAEYQPCWAVQRDVLCDECVALASQPRMLEDPQDHRRLHNIVTS
jgi:predicted RNA polymerase sigma factor